MAGALLVAEVFDPDLHIVIDGRRVGPVRDGAGRWTFHFRLPAGAIRLVSHASRPDELSLAPDARLLGVAITRLELVQEAACHEVPLDCDALVDGFHDVENGARRWTNGNAILDPGLLGPFTGPVALVVAADALPRYRVPDRAVQLDAVILRDFESLGQNCEFGFAQRACGVEPISLLRWSGQSIAMLADGLRARFDGLGDPDATELVWSERAAEYKLRDRRYVSVHTTVREPIRDHAAREDLRLRGAARLRLLRRKLLCDIAAARRIFVVASHETDFGPDRMRALHESVRAIGPATLFCVRVAAATEPVGVVEPLGETLFMGTLDRFVGAAGPHGVWRSLCRQVHALCAARRASQPGASREAA